MGPRRTPTSSQLEASKELGNSSRNERQKAQLLCEVNRMRRLQVHDAVEAGKRIQETSKKLCESEAEVRKGKKKTAS